MGCCLRLGRVPTLVVSSPDAARDVLRTHDHICASRSSTTVTRILLDGCSDMAFAPYGDEWRQHCRICSLHLLSPKMVQYYALVREQEVATMVAAICSRGLAAEIDMSAVLFAFSNDILCQIVTGKKFEGRKGLFSKLISENSVMLAKIYLGDYLPWLSWVDWLLGKVARVKKNHKRWGDLLDQKDPVLESILTPEVIKALLQGVANVEVASFSVYLPIFFGVVGSPAREGSFGEKLSSWDYFGRSSIRGTDGEGCRKRNMSAKFLQAFAADHDNPELQRQIGCMTGIFQMFDRQQILTRRRLNFVSKTETTVT
ncbi:cytochrome P450 71A1-like [Zingiber officinale]|uniref:cytochrome P450 71A1-like n=1 Tax=Zingiber officinale TaxID=94328 RepID=UPI001C4C1C3B|nr:cytochrome P450 71A1-like [Zingiber officinale]